MSMRLQVVMSEAEYAEIRSAAERHGSNVSEWVRAALRDARARDARSASSVVREGRPEYAAGSGLLGQRVHVELEVREELLEAVRERYHLPSWRAAVEYALARAAVRPMTKDEALAMQGVGWEGDLEAIRSGDAGSSW
jgi:Arc/MetJ family transcription regulator